MPAAIDTPPRGRSTRRALAIFEAFETHRRPLSLSELARAARLPVSTCHAALRALEEAGYLCQLEGRGIYPTRRLGDLADTIRAHDPIARRLEPRLARLREETGETVILGTRQRDAVQYLLVLESAQSIRYSARAGACKPLHSSAIGKVLLGALDAAALARWLASHALPAVTARTLTTAAALAADLARSRAQGYYLTRGENVADVMAVAAPLAFGQALFGVAVAGPVPRMEAALAAHVAALGAAATELGAAHAA
ncbi:MAG: IclR family transcriptional regulator C-terminal domain-containing protein [Gammaproteobacteria bacterium]